MFIPLFVSIRRQDRRTLNARNRRLMDAKLIIFIVLVGIILLCLGGGLLLLYMFYKDEFQHIRPVIVIGPVLLGGGVVTILCSGRVQPHYILFILNHSYCS